MQKIFRYQLIIIYYEHTVIQLDGEYFKWMGQIYDFTKMWNTVKLVLNTTSE